MSVVEGELSLVIMLLDNQVGGGRQEVEGGGGGEEEEGGGEDGRSSCKAWHENMKIISQFTVEVLANIFLSRCEAYFSHFWHSSTQPLALFPSMACPCNTFTSPGQAWYSANCWAAKINIIIT